VLAALALAAALSPALAGRIDALFADWDRPDSPGCTLGVARDGAMLYQRGYGMASLEYGAHNAPETVFPIGSNSKQFMAMLIALLAEDGKLSLDDDIRKYVPELPAYERPITVRQLVHHTSGLRDYQALRFLAGFPPDYLELAPVLALIARQKGLDFAPGERFEYSNTNYVLLRVIAERVSGKPLRELAAERIFAPLGMSHTQWSEDFHRLIPGRATVYTGDAATGFRSSDQGPLAGSGGVWTTVGDLLRWDENFDANRLGKGGPELIARVLAPEGGRDGEPASYAFGIFLGEHRGRPIY
jgi:CubicO group peptidase (beta-lactamase class C family)